MSEQKMLENAANENQGLEDIDEDLALLEQMGVGDNDLGEDISDEALMDLLPELGLDLDFSDEGLGALGAGRKRRRKGRRVKKSTRAKLRRAAKHRKRRKSGRFADIALGLGGGRKRRRKGGLGGVKKATLRRRGKRIAKKMKRSKRTGRFIGLKGLEGLDGLSDGFLSEISGDFSMDDDNLGALGVRHRKKSRKARRAGRKGRRKGRRGGRKSARMAGLGYLADIADGFGQAEVDASMPVVGAFQWLATGPGMEALGGAALAPIVNGIITMATSKMGLPVKWGDGKPAYRYILLNGLLSAVAMWELGKAVRSANIAKFGAFYALGRTVEKVVTSQFLFSMDAFKDLGLGDTQRIPDTSDKYIGTVRLPDEDTMVGLGTYRGADTSGAWQGVSDTQRIPDVSDKYIGQDADVETADGIGEDEEAEVEGVGAEDSDLF